VSPGGQLVLSLNSLFASALELLQLVAGENDLIDWIGCLLEEAKCGEPFANPEPGCVPWDALVEVKTDAMEPISVGDREPFDMVVVRGLLTASDDSPLRHWTVRLEPSTDPKDAGFTTYRENRRIGNLQRVIVVNP
jgi:hypothetical protein